MYNPPKLFSMIRRSAILCAFYFGFRAAIFAHFCAHAHIVVLAVVFVLLAFVGYTLSKNIWSKKGIVFMSFLLMLALTDAICIIAALCFGSFRVGVYRILWLGGVFGLGALVIFLVYGFFNERYVRKNTLIVTSPKLLECCSFAVLSDIHFGTIQPREVLERTIERVNSENYDGVILVGDIAEEHTSGEDLKKLFEELAKLKTQFGTFFVHGNHDRQEGLRDHRTYSDSEFDLLMKNSGIRNIDDSIVDIGQSIQLIGRKDYSFKDRKDVLAVLTDSDSNKLRIVVEHQPTECEQLSEKGVDVCLSAHYHGAQTWPNNIIYRLAGMWYNGKYYVGKMILYVNAGLTGSKYKFRTHGHCEYLELKLCPETNMEITGNDTE